MAATYPAAFRKDVDHHNPDEPQRSPRQSKKRLIHRDTCGPCRFPSKRVSNFHQLSKTIHADRLRRGVDRLLKVGTMTFETQASWGAGCPLRASWIRMVGCGNDPGPHTGRSNPSHQHPFMPDVVIHVENQQPSTRRGCLPELLVLDVGTLAIPPVLSPTLVTVTSLAEAS